MMPRQKKGIRDNQPVLIETDNKAPSRFEKEANRIIDTVRQICYLPAERDNFYKIIHEYH